MIDTSPPKRKRPRKSAAPEVSVDVNVFDIRCQCGERMSGPRTSETRLSPCPSCERLHYILPTNPYPEPRRVKSKKKRKPGKAGQALLTSLRGGLRSTGQALGRRARQMAVGAARRGVGAAVWMRRQVTPLRTISAAIVCVLIATVWYGVSSRRYSQAQVLFSDAWTAAQKELRAGDVKGADEQLQLAVKALNTMVPGDMLERQVRQLGRESFTLTHLSSYDLFDIAQDAQGYLENRNSSLWPTRFSTLYKGSWMIFDLQVRRVETSGEGGPKFEFAQDLTVGPAGMQVAADLPFLDELDLGNSFQRVIFAAQLEEWTREDRPEGPWKIRLNGETSFLWCHMETLSLAFEAKQPWESEGELQSLFASQASASGVEPATALLAEQVR